MGVLSKILIALILTFISVLSYSQKSADSEDQYERCSLHTMLIVHQNSRFSQSIEETYMKTPFPERFNNHDLGVRKISFAELAEDQTHNLNTFVSKVNIGQKMIAKWFNRDKVTGSFNMALIKERGCYNATTNQINEARASIRGLALIEDAGENLIHNTYLVVNDIDYQSKGSSLGLLKAYLTMSKDMSDWFKIGGFSVVVTSYLYRLVWNDNIANEFYQDCYTEDGIKEPKKVETFKQRQYDMEFVGKMTSKSSETHLTAAKNPEALLVKIMTRTIDHNLAQLQHSYPDFRIKAKLIVEDDNLSACIGKKEDVNENSQYEVLERVLDEEGHITYQRVGIIEPNKNHIWDNRYMATEDEEGANLSFTTFTKVSGKNFFSGMLIREI